MSIFEKVKKFYKQGIYTKYMVKQFVIKGKITAEQYEEITGEAYEED